MGNTKFKTDVEFPLIILCEDCHIFLHKNNRFRTAQEILEYHKTKINRHTDALVCVKSYPNGELRAQLTMEDFNK